MAVDFIPLTLRCAIFAKGFPGIYDTNSYPPKEVTLRNVFGLPDGEKLVDRMGDFEFWVSTDRTISGRGRIEILSYNLELRNMKNGVSTIARSDTSVEPRDGAMKPAAVSLVFRNSPGNAQRLNFNCANFGPALPEDKLMLNH